jgi:hypothetical protein
MKRLMTMLVATALASACAVPVGTPQEEVGAEESAVEIEVVPDQKNPEGPGSCAGWAYQGAPGYVVVPVECVVEDYYYMGDPWTWQQGDPEPEEIQGE